MFWTFSLAQLCHAACDSYFKGVDYLEKNNIAKAKSSFASSIKSSNSIESYLALRSLFEICTDAEKLSYSKKLYDSLPSSANPSFRNDVAALYALSLIDNAQYSKAEKLVSPFLESEGLTFEQRTCFLYCRAVSALELNKKDEYDFTDAKVQYFMRKIAYCNYHDDFLRRYGQQDFAEKSMLQLRQSVKNRKFNSALEIFFSEGFFRIEDMFGSELSDVGKAFIGASANSFSIDYASYAEKFASIASAKKTQMIAQKTFYNEVFYLYFYAAKFYDKISRKEEAAKYFLLAAENSFSDGTYDNALWYYFSTLNGISESRFLTALEKYGNTIKSKSYYSDLFENLFVSMLSQRRWTAFCSLNETVSKYCDKKTQAMFDYIFARLLEEDFVDKAKFPSFDEKQLFRRVVQNQYSANYYILISCERLGMSAKDALESLFVNNDFVSSDEKITADLTVFMDAAVKHKKIREAFSVFKNYRRYLSSDYLANFAHRVNELAKKDESLYPLVPRFASGAIYSAGKGKDLELFKLYSPQFYKDSVSKMCEKYSLQEDLMYGLIHSESFFDKDIVSFAGAVGLCQLMPFTAGDIAKKLKMSSFELTDADTNIEFGCFYFAEMIRRLDGSVMSAIVSYNSGITRVRNWHKKYPNVPIDIFVEMLPIAESRGYGKKVLSAAAIYGYLYYGKNTEDIIAQLLR